MHPLRVSKSRSRWFNASDIESGDNWKTYSGHTVTANGETYPIPAELERAVTDAANDAGVDYFEFVKRAVANARPERIEQALERVAEPYLPDYYALIREEHQDIERKPTKTAHAPKRDTTEAIKVVETYCGDTITVAGETREVPREVWTAIESAAHKRKSEPHAFVTTITKGLSKSAGARALLRAIKRFLPKALAARYEQTTKHSHG